MRTLLAAGAMLTIAASAAAQSQIDPGPPTHLPPNMRPGAVQYTYTARTVAPVRRSGEVVVLGVHWNCEGTTCTARGPWPRPVMAGCAALVGAIGPISALGRPGAEFTAAQVNECNGRAAAPPPTQSAGPAPVSLQAGELVLVGGAQSTAAPQPNGPTPIMSGELTLVGGAVGAPAGPSDTPAVELNSSELVLVGR